MVLLITDNSDHSHNNFHINIDLEGFRFGNVDLLNTIYCNYQFHIMFLRWHGNALLYANKFHEKKQFYNPVTPDRRPIFDQNNVWKTPIVVYSKNAYASSFQRNINTNNHHAIHITFLAFIIRLNCDLRLCTALLMLVRVNIRLSSQDAVSTQCLGVCFLTYQKLFPLVRR